MNNVLRLDRRPPATSVLGATLRAAERRQKVVNDLKAAARAAYSEWGLKSADTMVQLAVSSVREEWRMKERIREGKL